LFEAYEFPLCISHVVAHFYFVPSIKSCEVDDIRKLLNRLKKVRGRNWFIQGAGLSTAQISDTFRCIAVQICCLESCDEGVNRLGIEEPADRIADIPPAPWRLSSTAGIATSAATSEEVFMVEHMIEDNEPFLLNQRTVEEMADYGAGLNAGLAGEEVDDSKSEAWQRGWADAQE
jgi:hypothetical protein